MITTSKIDLWAKRRSRIGLNHFSVVALLERHDDHDDHGHDDDDDDHDDDDHGKQD